MSRFRLVRDYLLRADKRIKALEFLKNEAAYADVVREAQEVVELLLKGLIIAYGLEVPKVHDVGKFIEMELEAFPEIIRKNIKRIKYISRVLRKERELAFYGFFAPINLGDSRIAPTKKVAAGFSLREILVGAQHAEPN